MKVSFVSILSTAAIFISTVQCTGYSLWSAERQSGRVKFIPYTQEQRGSVVGNIDRMMKMWVSFESKQHHYNGNANPYPDLDEFRKTYASMTDEQFNFNLTKIFNKMRDKHTLYHKAGPYGCFSVSTGVFFNFVDDSLGGTNKTSLFLDLGANDSGGHSRAFRYLSGIEGSSNILPEADGITLQLKRVGISQAVYTVTVPYVALSNDECWSLSSNLYKELTGIALPEMPTPRSFRYKRSAVGNGNEVTKDLFYKGVTSKSPWSKAWSATSYSSRYSGLGSAYDSSVSNTFGQAYFNPVGVYTDGMCYSACEVFAAQIQDHKIGTVFGEDETTGGGGANVLSSHDELFHGSSIAIHRRPIQGKSHRKKTLATHSIPELVAVSTYDRISEYLSDVAKKQADKNVYFEYEPHSQSVFNDSMDVTVVASGVDEIIVVSQGKQLGEWRGELSTSRQDCKITVKTPTGLRDHMITFIGKKQGTQVFKTHREFTRVPTLDNRVNMMTTNSYTVSGLSPSVGVYSFAPMSEKEGWNFNNGKWILGDGVSDYSGYMHSTVRAWLSAPVGSTISVSIDAIVDTYESGGFFSLNMMDDSGEVVHMLSSPSDDESAPYQSITGRNRVIKETHSFEVTTEHFALNMDFVAYSMETPFSVKINSVVLTKD
ncbi:hypothetical protein BASA62_008628 [Batrachochytrium salamandrivorans]|nr:hypothetical protein BASA62_008628 [Batrachochytrium salamandrivorans]